MTKKGMAWLPVIIFGIAFCGAFVRKVFNRYLDPGYELNCYCVGVGDLPKKKEQQKKRERQRRENNKKDREEVNLK